MFHAAIAGTGRAVPAKLLTNADLETLVETTDEWITTRTGIRERHMAADGGSSRTSVSRPGPRPSRARASRRKTSTPC